MVDTRGDQPRLLVGASSSWLGPQVWRSDDLGETLAGDAQRRRPLPRRHRRDGRAGLAAGARAPRTASSTPAPSRARSSAPPTAARRSRSSGRCGTTRTGRSGAPASAARPSTPCCRTPPTRARSPPPSPPAASTRPTTAGSRGSRATRASGPSSCPRASSTPSSASACTRSPGTPPQPERLFLQNHGGVYRSDDEGASWESIADGLPADFGFPIVVHPHEPDTIYVFPINGGDGATRRTPRPGCGAPRRGRDLGGAREGPARLVLRRRDARRDVRRPAPRGGHLLRRPQRRRLGLGRRGRDLAGAGQRPPGRDGGARRRAGRSERSLAMANRSTDAARSTTIDADAAPRPRAGQRLPRVDHLVAVGGRRPRPPAHLHRSRTPASVRATPGGQPQGRAGHMEITSSTPERIAIQLSFLKPWKATNEVTFGFTPTGNGTEVTWRMTGENTGVAGAVQQGVQHGEVRRQGLRQGPGPAQGRRRDGRLRSHEGSPCKRGRETDSASHSLVSRRSGPVGTPARAEVRSRHARPRRTSSPAPATSPTGSRRPPHAACSAPSAWATTTSPSRRSASRRRGTRSPRATCRSTGSPRPSRTACTRRAATRWSSAPSRSPTASRWATRACTSRWSPAR